MPRNAKTPVGGQGQGRARVLDHGNYSSTERVNSPSSAYQMIQASAYECVLNEPLDDLARQAVDRAYMAGWIVNDPTIPEHHRQAYQALSDGTAARLLERVRAYEMVLRTTSVPERPRKPEQANGRKRYGRVSK